MASGSLQHIRPLELASFLHLPALKKSKNLLSSESKVGLGFFYPQI
jgi:hypothetical protein